MRVLTVAHVACEKVSDVSRGGGEAVDGHDTTKGLRKQ